MRNSKIKPHELSGEFSIMSPKPNYLGGVASSIISLIAIGPKKVQHVEIYSNRKVVERGNETKPTRPERLARGIYIPKFTKEKGVKEFNFASDDELINFIRIRYGIRELQLSMLPEYLQFIRSVDNPIEKIHMLRPSGKSIFCTGRHAGQWLIVTKDPNKVTCLACMRKLYKK